MSRHSYQGIHKIKVLLLQLTGGFGFIISTFVCVFTLVGVGVITQQNNPTPILNDPRLTLICLAVWILVVGWSISFILVNYLPTIWTDEDSIQISAYIFFRIRIPWSSIMDIGSGNPPKGYLLVRARRVTIFHRAYGWLYSQTLHPSFLIESEITDRDKLIKEITQRIKINSPGANT